MPFLSDSHGTLTYDQVAKRTNVLASRLTAVSAINVPKVALLSANSAAAVCAILAVHRASAIFVPLNASFSLIEHLAAVRDVEADILLYSSQMEDTARRLLDQTASLKSAICIDDKDFCANSVEDLADHVRSYPWDDRASSPQDIVAIYPTGGSTGTPKRVMHSRLNWSTMAACFHTSVDIGENARYLAAPPITHAAGAFAFMFMAKGAEIYLQDGFDADAILRSIERDRITHLYLPPTAIYRLLEHPDLANFDTSSLMGFFYTAAPMSTEKLRQCIAAFGPVMIQFWGQMEAPSFCTCLNAADHQPDNPALAHRLTSCGRETMFARVEVMDDQGNLLAAGDRGELVLRSNLVMPGYYRNEVATAEVSRNGWHLTGDIGLKDKDGYVYIVGRKRDIIITGGYNVYPLDIEQALLAHPDVEECAVIGVPDAKWGEAVLAVIQLKEDRTADREDLTAHCKDLLGSIRTPKKFEFIDKIPRNAVGKVDKPAIREPYWRDVNRAI